VKRTIFVLGAAFVASVAGCQFLLPDGEEDDASTSGPQGGAGSTSRASSGDATTGKSGSSSAKATTGTDATTAGSTSHSAVATTGTDAASTTGVTTVSVSSSIASSSSGLTTTGMSSSGSGMTCAPGLNCLMPGATPTFQQCGPDVVCGGNPQSICSEYCSSLKGVCTGNNLGQFPSDDACCAVCAVVGQLQDPTNNACCRAEALNGTSPPGTVANCTKAGPMGSNQNKGSPTIGSCGTQVDHVCELFVAACAPSCGVAECASKHASASFTPYYAGASSGNLQTLTTLSISAIQGNLSACTQAQMIGCP
jgi:hypothetical protein